MNIARNTTPSVPTPTPPVSAPRPRPPSTSLAPTRWWICGQTALGSLGAWNAGNYHNGRGNYHVNEVFVEFGIPLLNDSFWGKADLDIAGRHARYSTAGDANTWKVGVTWDTPIPGIRLRALQSRDLRAPNLSELFSPPQGLNGSINNEFTGQPGQGVRQLNEGNPLLKVEKSQTTEWASCGSRTSSPASRPRSTTTASA